VNVTGKVVLITGASVGIGLAAGRLHASRGAKGVIAARSIDTLNTIAGRAVQKR
jgi:NADP-dependent 3-hydroxy acid dehydrogenase YdfG